MQTHLLYWLLFVVTMLVSYGLLMSWWPHRTNRRLSELLRSDPSATSGLSARVATLWHSRLMPWLLRITPWLQRTQTDTTTEGEASSVTAQSLRRRLLNAGLQSPQAVAMFQALQTGLVLLCCLLMLLLLWWNRASWQQTSMVILLVLAGMIGYALPWVWLQRRIQHRQAILFKGFPDALDLMRMCIQAGLGLDATLDRVGREIRLSCPPLSQELALTGYELRAGASRSEALRHLAERVALPDVEAWVNTLVQSDRFGTSISESLQVYSDALRNKRKLVAQEAAAKLPIKLLIPLVFCLFPGLLTVLLGPAVINIATHLKPVLTNQP